VQSTREDGHSNVRHPRLGVAPEPLDEGLVAAALDSPKSRLYRSYGTLASTIEIGVGVETTPS
jgi:hypothetical protein